MSTPRVLIVDDDAVNTDLARFVLQEGNAIQRPN